MPTLLREAALQHGDRLLLVADGERLSFVEAERRSAELARGLLADGVGKGERIGLLLPNGVDWAICFFAIGRIGAIAVALNTFWQAPELAYALRDADVARLITAPSFRGHDYLERLETAIGGLATARGDRALALTSHPYLRQIRQVGDAARGWLRGSVEELSLLGAPARVGDARCEGSEWGGPPASVALISNGGEPGEGAPTPDLLPEIESEVRAADWLAIVYSSGSTASPKGVVHSHGAIVRQAEAMAAVYELGPDERLYSPMPFFWVGGFVVSLLGPLASGAALLTHAAFDPEKTLDLLEAERATVVIGWPHFARAMVEHETFAGRDLSTIRRGSMLALLPEAARPRDPQMRSNSLGMTETCGPHAAAPPGTGELPEHLRGAFGRGVPGIEHRIVDPKTRAVLASGVSGEIEVRGSTVLQGLYKKEREEIFTRDGFYPTGDAGHLSEDGWLFFEGRLGDVIKTGGANVSPAEVEAALSALPGVAQAWVVGIPDEDRGERVAAALVAAAETVLDVAQIRVALRVQLSSYKIPGYFRICRADELPFTDSGKIRRAELALFLAEGARRREATEPIG